MVWPFDGTWHHHGALHSRGDCHGDHQSTQQFVPDMPADLWCGLPRETRCKHGVCHLLLYQLCAGHQILVGPETGPLHENPPQIAFQSSDGGDVGF